MLLSTNALVGYTLVGQDGEIGRCKDFLVDDEKWVVRYMVADTGMWLPKKKVLIYPIALGSPDWQSKSIPVRLRKDQVEEAPRLDDDAPVSRQFERQYMGYYGYRPYWRGVQLWGAAALPGPLYEGAAELPEAYEGAAELPEAATDTEGDPHLRSVDELSRYRIEATDGEFGHVEDLIVDHDNWKVRYVAIDTRNWFPSRKVVVSPDWIESVDWAESTIKFPLTVDEIKSAPPYDPHAPVNRVYEARLYDYYGRPQYW